MNAVAKLAEWLKVRLIRPEWIVSTLLVLVTVIALPIVGYFVNEDAPPAPVAESDAADLPASAYAVAESRLLTIGDGPLQIAPRASVGAAEPAETFSAFIATDEGEMWVVDWPASVSPDVRVRRLGADGELLSSFVVPVGAAVFVPAPDGTLWVDFAPGEGAAEVIRRYSVEGELLAEHALPEGLYARWITFSPDGALWVQHEESEVDVKTFATVYRSRLVPILDASGVPIADPGAGTIDGNFFGPDGWLYELQVDPLEAEDQPEDASFTVVGTGPQGEKRTYSLPPYHRPFAADTQGRIYSEPVGAPARDDYFRHSIGDAVLGSTTVLVTVAEGPYASIALARPDGLTGLHPSASVTPGGELWSASRDARGFWLHRWADAESSSELPEEAARDAEAMVLAGLAPATLDPYRAADPQVRDLMRLVFAGLVRHGENAEPVADLAERIPAEGDGVSADGLTLTYTLRSGLTWHDGLPVTGQDIVATWQYLKQPAPIARPEPFEGFELITAVEADGQTVRVTLSEPFGPGPESFFPYVLPAHLLGDAVSQAVYWQAPVGCGPYAFASLPDDERWHLVAHDGSPRGEVALSRLDVRFAIEDDALSTFESSPVPAIWQWPQPSALPQLRRDAVGETVRVPTGRWIGIIINPENVTSANVRRSIIASYPLQALGEDVLPVESADASPTLFAGTPEGGEVAVTASATSGGAFRYTCGLRFGWPEISYEQITVVEEAWAARGFSVDRTVGRAELYRPWTAGGTLARGDFDVAGGTFDAPSDAGYGGPFDATDRPSADNPSGTGVIPVADRAVVQLYEQARRTYDRAERIEITRRLERALGELGVFAFDRAEYRDAVMLGSIEGYAPQPYPAGDFWNIESWTLGGESDAP